MDKSIRQWIFVGSFATLLSLIVKGDEVNITSPTGHYFTRETDGFKQTILMKVTPEEMAEIAWKKSTIIYINITCDIVDKPSNTDNSLNVLTTPEVHLSSADQAIAKILSDNVRQLHLNCSDQYLNVSQTFTIEIEGVFLGKTHLLVTITDPDDVNSTWGEMMYDLVVINEETPLYLSFIIVVAVLIILLNFGFGCLINLDVVKAIWRKPVAPAIGLTCQIILMPLLGLGVSKLLHMDPTLGFGLFVISCAPGGSGSNVWTYLLGGDLDLSMTMTLCSKTMAFATMPCWLYAVGRLYIPDDVKIKIPIPNLLTGLLSIAIPLILGVLLNKFKPHIAKKVAKCLKPVAVIFILWVFIVGSLTNTYIYYIMASNWNVIPSGCLLAYLGMLAGLAVAKIGQQPPERITAISIETGIQDSGIAILLLLSSFEKPLGSIAATIAIVTSIFTPIPLIIAQLCKVGRRCCRDGRCCKCCGPSSVEEPMDDKIEAETFLGAKNETNGSPLAVNNKQVSEVANDRKFNRGEKYASRNYNTKM